jgi:hypothetical protein
VRSDFWGGTSSASSAVPLHFSLAKRHSHCSALPNSSIARKWFPFLIYTSTSDFHFSLAKRHSHCSALPNSSLSLFGFAELVTLTVRLCRTRHFHCSALPNSSLSLFGFAELVTFTVRLCRTTRRSLAAAVLRYIARCRLRSGDIRSDAIHKYGITGPL